MAANSGDLSALLARLDLDDGNADHDKILQAVNTHLAKSKNDVNLQHMRSVALLKLDRFDDALRQFEQGGDKLKQKAPLEYAYALYKTGKLEEASKVASGNSGRGINHVLAQATYRAEDFQSASNVYQKLASRPQDGQAFESPNDININSLAVDAQLHWQSNGGLSKKNKLGREDMEAFETAYNAACFSISRGELAQAEVLLKRARDLCLASDLSEEDKKAELMPIVVQQIYLLNQLQRTDEAKQLAAEVSIPEVPDASTRHIAQMNGFASSGQTENPYLSKRKLESTSNIPRNDRLFAFQQSLMDHNNYITELQSNKHEGVARSTLSKISTQPTSTTSFATNALSVLNAAANTKGLSGRSAIKQLLPLVHRRPRDVGLALTVVQLYCQESNYGAATPLLENFLKRLEDSAEAGDHDVRFSPGLVAAQVALYAKAGRKAAVRSELAKATDYWRQQTKNPPVSLLMAAGIYLIESHQPEDLEKAGEIFSSLLENDANNHAAAAGLVAAYATTHPEKISPAQLDKLTPVPRLIADVDVDALEAAGIATPPHLQSAAKRSAPKEKEQPAMKKKIRQSRIPKDFDPDKKVDPERWLPMKDRSYYRPKGKKGKKRDAGLTQGGFVEEPKTNQAQVSVGGGGGGQGKKKKKGRK
ncbi:signal recognition particle protein-like protein [Phyllosticta paracitricarpa]|uniref:Signal recognition particle subunit SRP72 n=1 Tax=Phyllosticta paracitricarpa TaxID=2016321 RepID=A0ABR1MXY2_9PEZI